MTKGIELAFHIYFSSPPTASLISPPGEPPSVGASRLEYMVFPPHGQLLRHFSATHLRYLKDCNMIDIMMSNIVDDARKTSEQLTRVLSKIKISADIIEAQSYVSDGKLRHRFTPFQEDVLDFPPVRVIYLEVTL
jgi:hypothetical protein